MSNKIEEWLGSLPEESIDSIINLDPKDIQLLVGLNPSQLKAALAVDGPVQIDAVPGSGKTHTLTRRIAHMVKLGINPGSILLTTFTKKASEEMKERLKSVVPKMAVIQMTIGTTHSIGWKILSKEYKNMNNPLARAFTSNSSKFLVNGRLKIFADKVKKSIIQDRTIPFSMKETLRDMPVPQLIKVISNAKSEGKDVLEFEEEHYDRGDKNDVYIEFYKRYEQAKQLECVVDSDDLLFLLWKLFKEHPDVLAKYQKIYKYILVDEAQDSNAMQYDIVRMLAYPENNIFMVGDADQAMYGFRGAKPEEFIAFAKNYKNTQLIPLEDNYRSNPHVLTVANSLIKNNKSRLDKKLKAHKQHDGDSVYFTPYKDESEEATHTIGDIKIKIEQEGVSPKDIAILYRTNAQSRSLEDRLIIEGIPYVIHGGISFYERKEVKDLVAYMQLAVDRNNDKAVDRVINVPGRYLGKVFKERMKACKGSYWEALHGGFRMESYMERGANEFIKLVDHLGSLVEEGTSPADLVDYMMDDFYAQYLKDEGEDEDEGSSRFENIETLKFALEQYENVEDFLNYIDIMTSNAKQSIDGVQLMTIHKSKGLEFKKVYIVGCSQGMLPHFKSVEAVKNHTNSLAIEEERRLLFVAITRAEDECFISSSGTFNGKSVPMSQFIKELGLPLQDDVVHATGAVDEDGKMIYIADKIDKAYKEKVLDPIAKEHTQVLKDAMGE